MAEYLATTLGPDSPRVQLPQLLCAELYRRNRSLLTKDVLQRYEDARSSITTRAPNWKLLDDMLIDAWSGRRGASPVRPT